MWQTALTDPSINFDRTPPPKHDVSATPKPFQFRLRTLFIVTVAVAVLLGIGRVVGGSNSIGFVVLLGSLGVIFVMPIAGVVVIARKSGLECREWEKGTLVLCTGIHSVGMMMLATVAFPPSWKGDKGLDWIYYRVLRAVYNEFAPTVARCIVFRWTADIVYLLLKPVEWMAVTINRLWAP